MFKRVRRCFAFEPGFGYAHFKLTEISLELGSCELIARIDKLDERIHAFPIASLDEVKVALG
jgi:hypothetical protein